MSAPFLTITPDSYPNAEIRFKLGTLVPTPTPGSGVAQYSTITRPRKRDLKEFTSESPAQVTLSVIRDEFENDGNLGDEFGRIYGWAARGNLPVMPTVLRTDGPIPFSDLRWILTDIELMDSKYRQSDWAMSYFELKLELTEWNDIDLIVQGNPSPAATASPAAAAQQSFQEQHAQDIAENPKLAIAYGVQYTGYASGAQQQRTYTVKRGDTLSKIAAQQLGNTNRWKEIAGLSGIRDPNRIAVGQVLRLPT